MYLFLTDIIGLISYAFTIYRFLFDYGPRLKIRGPCKPRSSVILGFSISNDSLFITNLWLFVQVMPETELLYETKLASEIMTSNFLRGVELIARF